MSIFESSSLDASCGVLVSENSEAREKVELAGCVVRNLVSSKMTSRVIWIFLREGM
jgi:hypothetical protein